MGRQGHERGSSGPRSTPRTTLRTSLWLVIMGVSFGLGRMTTSHGPAHRSEGPPIDQDHTANLSVIPRLRPARAPVLMSTQKLEPDERPSFRAATKALDGLMVTLQRTSLRNSTDPIRTWNEMEPYFRGWVDSLATVAPDVVAEMGPMVADRFCADEGPPPVEALALAKMARLTPGLVTPLLIKCAVRTHGQEGQILWSILDAWRAARLPKTSDLIELERNAMDPRTKRRLVSREVEAQIRDPQSLQVTR
jgi:hypothetical protein